ncbi:unnamed protein product [Prorocentrum cordatum]|uniref:6-pyruvoyltetrahydropterin synthase n=1 Tax=Prorocentrum cordatum TaxID=2364126 RepID=A0ABN9QH31_9DINO|nr:unnamed protein product [Polarella glacialis]
MFERLRRCMSSVSVKTRTEDIRGMFFSCRDFPAVSGTARHGHTLFLTDSHGGEHRMAIEVDISWGWKSQAVQGHGASTSPERGERVSFESGRKHLQRKKARTSPTKAEDRLGDGGGKGGRVFDLEEKIDALARFHAGSFTPKPPNELPPHGSFISSGTPAT